MIYKGKSNTNEVESMKIDKNIPLPSIHGKVKYPFNEMAIGDSFAVKKVDLHRVRSASWAAGKRLNMRFSVLAYKDAYRCWRIA